MNFLMLCVCHVFAFVQCTISSSQKSSNAKLRLNIGELGAKWNKKFRNGTVFHFAPQFYLCSFVCFLTMCVQLEIKLKTHLYSKARV